MDVGRYNRTTLVLSLVSAASALVSAISDVTGGFALPTTIAQSVFVISMIALSWCLSHLFTTWKFGNGARTPHNLLCVEILDRLGELPREERWGYIEKGVAHDEVDGKDDFTNALRSLVDQGCIRGLEVVDYFDGHCSAHADATLGVTGKRYVDD